MSSNLASTLGALLQRLRLIRTIISAPSFWASQSLRAVLSKLLENPHVAELLRFIFLGTVVETSRIVGQKAVDFVKHFFVVKASFTRGDFAYDWVKRYLEDQHVWDTSRIFRVTATNPRRVGLDIASSTTHSGPVDVETTDGRPHPVYQPAPREPELFRWKTHWITVNMNMDNAGYGDDGAQVLTLSVYSRNRKILDEFVQEAREHYFNSPLPPREIYSLPDMSGALLTARFTQGDLSYEWMLAFVRAQEGYEEITDLQVTTKQSELPFNPEDPDDRPLAAFKPAPRVKQRLKWRDHWVQFDVEPGSSNYDGRSYGGNIAVTLHNAKRSVLQELVVAAREEYLKSTVSKVTVHLSDRYGSWVKVVTKSRRALNTLILPEGIKEMLLADAREFLDSEEWYTWAGVPHRRGYLLYGEPGTGKSSTIHALASELGLEIYYVQLASQGMDDHNLGRLIADTPSRCILLLEDIDCAFPSREDDDEDEPQLDTYGNPVYNPYSQPRSEVTLSGLLNVLDSVTSEEGRIVFATTNHIERLDPALIRAGRMDVKIEYKLASKQQIHQTFLRFFEHRFMSAAEQARLQATSTSTSNDVSSSAQPDGSPPSVLSIFPDMPRPAHKKEVPHLSPEEILELAIKFSEQIPEDTFSLAQIQGYMLTKKTDPRGAVDSAAGWTEAQLEERRKLEEAKAKRRAKAKERARKAAEARAKQEAENVSVVLTKDEDAGEDSAESAEVHGAGVAHATAESFPAADAPAAGEGDNWGSHSTRPAPDGVVQMKAVNGREVTVNGVVSEGTGTPSEPVVVTDE